MMDTDASIRAKALRDAADAVFDTALDAEVAAWLRRLASEEESGDIELGDLVEVTIRGEVTWVGPDGDFGFGSGEDSTNIRRPLKGLTIRRLECQQ